MAAPLKLYSPAARRQLGQMDLLASPSRSGGHGAADDDALLSFATQEQFRAHIEEKLVSLRARFGEVLADGWGQVLSMEFERESYYAVVDMLLLLRKLREGIVASKRRDAFAVEVYETAAVLALKTASHAHLVPALSGLVRDLYPALDRPDQPADRLAASLDSLSLAPQPPPKTKSSYVPPHLRKAAAAASAPTVGPSPTPAPPPSPPSTADNRELFVSIYLILQLSHHASPPSFVALLSELTGSPSALYPSSSTTASLPLQRRSTPRPGKEVARPILPPNSPALALPLRVYRAHVSADFLGLHRLLAPTPPVGVHALERLALLYGLHKQRALGWRITRAAYRDVGEAELPWLETDVLGFQGGQGEGRRWLEDEKRCTKGPTGRWLLKTGAE